MGESKEKECLLAKFQIDSVNYSLLQVIRPRILHPDIALNAHMHPGPGPVY